MARPDPVLESDRVTAPSKVSRSALNHSWWDRIVAEVMDPETDLVLQQSRRRDPYLRMRWRDHEIATAYESVIGPIVAARWQAKPAAGDDRPAAIEAAAQVSEDLDRSPGLPHVLEEFGERPFRGWGGTELNGSLGGLGDVTNGEPLIPDDFDTRPTEIPPFALTWETESGRARLLTDEDSYRGIALDRPEWRTKFLIGSWGSTEGGNWRGSGWGMRVWYLHAIARKLWQDWASGNERLGNPWVVAQIGVEGQYKTQAAVMKRLIRDTAANGGGIVLPHYIDSLTLLGDKMPFDSFAQMMDALNAAIHKAIKGETLTTEQGDRGAFALGAIHADQLTERQWYVIRAFQRWLRPLLKWVCELRYGQDYGLVAEPVFETVEDEALAITKLSSAADLGLEVLTNEVYEKHGLTRPDGLEDTMKLSKAAVATPGLGAPGLSLFADRQIAHPRIVKQEQAALDEVEDGVIRATGRDMAKRVIPELRKRLRPGK